MVWLTAWTRFRLDSPVPLRVEVLLLDPAKARSAKRPSAVLDADALLTALVNQAAGPVPLRAEVPADRRLFAVLLDRIGAAHSLPLLVRRPSDGRLETAVNAASKLAEGGAPSIADLASSMGTCRKTVERAFARDVGLTAGRWRQQVTFTRAVALLSQGRRVGDVARDVGYRTPSAFVAAFRKAMGTTPKRFVNQPKHR
jgi:AraC-like DNA-binding protein